MKHLLRIIVVCFFTLLAAGCASLYPLPVDEKDIMDNLEKHDKLYNGTKGLYGLEPATDHPQAIKNLRIYSDWYFLKTNNLRKYQFELKDRSLFFGIAGMLAGIAKSPEWAVGGTLLASSVEMPNDRYQLSVQSANYEKASDTMYCMYRHLAPYQNDTNVLPFVKFLNDRIYEVRRKLRKAQTSITLTSPDLTKLTASLKKVVNQEVEVIKAADEAEKAKDDSEKAAANLVTANFSISASKAIPAAVTAAFFC